MTIPREVSSGSRGSAVMPGEERRRSQRVIIRMRVTLEIKQNGQTEKIEAYTVAVNTHGAMVVCPRALESGQALSLIYERTREKASCRVTRAPRESDEGFLIPLEFTSPSPNFWQISFPPANWKGTDE